MRCLPKLTIGLALTASLAALPARAMNQKAEIGKPRVEKVKLYSVSVSGHHGIRRPKSRIITLTLNNDHTGKYAAGKLVAKLKKAGHEVRILPLTSLRPGVTIVHAQPLASTPQSYPSR